MIRIELCDPAKEHTCDSCEWADVCPCLGSSPLLFADGGEVKCVVIDSGTSGATLLVPERIEFAAHGARPVGFTVVARRFRRASFWRWLRRVFT